MFFKICYLPRARRGEINKIMAPAVRGFIVSGELQNKCHRREGRGRLRRGAEPSGGKSRDGREGDEVRKLLASSNRNL